MKKYLLILLLFIGFSSCNEFQKALKSESVAEKFKFGTQLYEDGKYAKANRLFVQIVPNYRGKPQAEKLMYMYSKSFYEMKDFYLAGYQFERFVTSYPKSEKVEEAAYLSAKSYYLLCPIYTKDQKDTVDAIEKLQVFINTYPESEYISEANVMVKELDFKLERKAFEIAKQYNTITDYKASINSFNNFLLEYPGSILREEALYVRSDSAYKLAVNSVEYKKAARLKTAQIYLDSFIGSFPNSDKLQVTKDMLQEVNNQLETVNTKS
ncbi:MAG: outer membrane protein assembly factor BamD [Flavobacteriaceae bacterium]|nr:outer membrane protein assembly factor BamD [Bacteroidia bacterium]NNL15764.1 outer membrane protein assembly factor BamD [Flavobacteriaceae bacterium]